MLGMAGRTNRGIDRTIVCVSSKITRAASEDEA